MILYGKYNLPTYKGYTSQDKVQMQELLGNIRREGGKRGAFQNMLHPMRNVHEEVSEQGLL